MSENKMKVCSKCSRELPLSNFYKDKTHKDGHRSMCKECFKNHKPKKKEPILQDGMKKCSKCNKWYPANLIYFRKNNCTKSKLSSRCKECLGYRFEEKSKEGFRFCYRCHKELPLSGEYFPRQSNKSGFDYICKECCKKRYIQNREKRLEYSKYYEANVRKDRTEYRKLWWQKAKNNTKYYKKHREMCRIGNQKYRKTEKGRESNRIHLQNRRSKLKELEYNFSRKDWKECKKHFTNRKEILYCAYCGKEMKKATQDHFIALNKGGRYTKSNIIPCCLKCNQSKSDKDFFEWYSKQEFYSKEREDKVLKYLNSI